MNGAGFGIDTCKSNTGPGIYTKLSSNNLGKTANRRSTSPLYGLPTDQEVGGSDPSGRANQSHAAQGISMTTGPVEARGPPLVRERSARDSPPRDCAIRPQRFALTAR